MEVEVRFYSVSLSLIQGGEFLRRWQTWHSLLPRSCLMLGHNLCRLFCILYLLLSVFPPLSFPSGRACTSDLSMRQPAALAFC